MPGPTTAFSKLGARAQIAVLRARVPEVLAEFGIQASRVRILCHGFNTTFRIDTLSDHKFALRMNVSSKSNLGQLRAETEWIMALGHAKIVQVARPQPARNGGYVVSLNGVLDTPINCVLYSWLRGRVAGERRSPEVLRQLGEATRNMHEHAAGWPIPDGAEFMPIQDVLYGHPFTLPKNGVFGRVLRRTEDVFARLRRMPRLPIHNDLHLHNLKVYRGRIAIFDFDDAVLGWPVLDAAVTAFNLRGREDDAQLEDSYWRGLGRSVEELGVSRPDFEVLVAGQAVFLANEFGTIINPAMRSRRESYLAAAERRLTEFERTGTYDASVAKWDSPW